MSTSVRELVMRVGGWGVTLDCGHETIMEDKGPGVPVGTRCKECETHGLPR